VRRLTAAALSGVVGAALAVVATPVVAHADPAGPTDFRSEITRLDPPTDAVTASIVGGDAFVLLEVAPGTEVVVVGYAGEPYLWFRPDGSVAENASSPARYLNEERFGGDVPDGVDPDAPPEWIEVGSGAHAWHDHRAHRMDRGRPPGAEPGDVVLDGVIPLVVDGRPVDLHVTSTLLAAPSPWPWVLLALGAGVAVVLAGRRSTHAAAVVTTLTAGIALVVGTWQFRSLPAETGPSITWWALPLTALVAAAIALGTAGRPGITSTGALAVAGVQLVVWGWQRRDGLTRALLPTDAPAWLDRLATALALGVGVAAVVVAGLTLGALWRHPAPAQAPTPT
jgi:hypothetical protein